jgi:ribosomal protein S27AE
MTTPKETCPKCSAGIFGTAASATSYKCGTRDYTDGVFVQSDRCRITGLEKEVERLREKIGNAFEELDMEKQAWTVEVASEVLGGNIVKEQYAKGRLNGIEVALQSLSPLSTLLAEGGKTE